MDPKPGFHNRGYHITLKIRSLLISLTSEPSEYDNITPKIEFWIDYVLREQFVTVDELVEGVSLVAWDQGGSYASVGRFLKGFHDAPHRSEQARSFVDKLCEYVLRWFAIAAADDLLSGWGNSVASNSGWGGFVRAASFVGHLVECGVLGHDLVRRHLVKPLITHHHTDPNGAKSTRASAIYQLFAAAGNTLLHGLLEPEDVQACFEILNAHISLGGIAGLDAGKLQEFREIHAAWLEQEEMEEKWDSTETEESDGEEEDMWAGEVPAEIETPVAFVPRDLPTAAVDVDIPSSIFCDTVSSFETFVKTPATTITSPALSISTLSDLTPTELGEEVIHTEERTTARQDTFYFQGGNVEIACGDTVFRVHSNVVSSPSYKLRSVLSPLALLHAPTPGGCPRITVPDNPEDFAVLLKVIYTPGFPARDGVPEFSVFAQVLRMVTKYDLSDVLEELFKFLKGAYPTRWEHFQAAKVLGEDVFGSPKPHPNAVLNLFETEGVRFAIPFAAYRASMGGLPALMSKDPGTVLPHHTLASTIYGMKSTRSFMSQVAHRIAYEENLLSVCPDKACVLNVRAEFMERRWEALTKLYNAITDNKGTGDVLSPLSLGDLACAKCTEEIEASHSTWRSRCWERLRGFFWSRGEAATYNSLFMSTIPSSISLES